MSFNKRISKFLAALTIGSCVMPGFNDCISAMEYGFSLNSYIRWVNKEWKDRKDDTPSDEFYELWRRRFPIKEGTNKNVNKNYKDFMSLLEQDKKLFNDCGFELQKDIKDIYEEIFQNVFNSIYLNKEYVISQGIPNDTQIIDKTLRKYINLPPHTDINDILTSGPYCDCQCYGFGHCYPCRYENKNGRLVFIIEVCRTDIIHDSYLYFVKLKFEPNLRELI